MTGIPNYLLEVIRTGVMTLYANVYALENHSYKLENYCESNCMRSDINIASLSAYVDCSLAFAYKFVIFSARKMSCKLCFLSCNLQSLALDMPSLILLLPSIVILQYLGDPLRLPHSGHLKSHSALELPVNNLKWEQFVVI